MKFDKIFSWEEHRDILRLHKSSGKRKQKIHISYDLIGFIPVDVLTKAEQA